MEVTYEITETLTTEEEQILNWRFESLQRVGFDPELAFEIAARRAVDLHDALGLVARGCPPPTAARILL